MLTYAEQIERVREYVRDGRNREWANKSTFTLRSKPLWLIAEELGMPMDAVSSAMHGGGWYDAAMDAEKNDGRCKPVADTSAGTKKSTKRGPPAPPLVTNPRGWT